MSRLSLIALVCAVAFVASVANAAKLPASAQPTKSFLAKYDEIMRLSKQDVGPKFAKMLVDAGKTLDCDTDYSDPKLALIAKVLRACHTKEPCTEAHDRFIHSLMNGPEIEEESNFFIYVDNCKNTFTQKCNPQ